MTPGTSLYFHIPFCAHRCAYCDINTYAGQEDSIPAYVDALCNEIKAAGRHGRLEVATIFFGGGTPSLLSPAHYRDIFHTIFEHFDVSPAAEISLEANPGTVSPGYLRELREIGFNRISYGVQSANPTELRMLERIHSYSDVVDAVRWSRAAGFENLNLDLIYALPEQTLESWQHTVKLVVGLRPEHLSAYALTLEHGTPFGRWASKGLLPIPDPDLAADMYEWLAGFLAADGYVQYEISNWAKSNGRKSKVEGQKPDFACAHNLQYWRNLNYLGLGAGAHGYADGVRYSNVLRIKTYIDRLAPPLSSFIFPLTPATVNHHRNTPRENMQETLMTGLRLTREGVREGDFRARFGLGLEDAFPKEIQKLLRLNLLEKAPLADGDFALRLTPQARLVANQVFLEFVGE